MLTTFVILLPVSVNKFYFLKNLSLFVLSGWYSIVYPYIRVIFVMITNNKNKIKPNITLYP
jgi:hypothetical protein